MSFKFEIKGSSGLQKELKEYPEEIKDDIRKVLVKHVAAINEKQQLNASRFTDRSQLIKGINWMPAGELNFLMFSQAPYSAYLEFGTRTKFKAIPGVDASPYKGSGGGGGKGFFEAILKWVKRKGVASTFSTGVTKAKGGGFTYDASKARRKRTGKAQDKKDRQVAYMIYRSILKNGINPQPFFFGPFLTGRQEILDDVEKVINGKK